LGLDLSGSGRRSDDGKDESFPGDHPEAQKLGWFNMKHLQSAKRTWEIFMTLRELHGDKYCRDNLVGIEWELQRLLEAGAEKSPEAWTSSSE
jgi:hypothetical protein